MSEYNIQMNKYNASKAGYDQLYPATKIANVDGLDTALQNNDPKKWGLGIVLANTPGAVITDFDDILPTGFYYVQSGSLNRPIHGAVYAVVINRSYNDVTVFAESPDGVIARRKYKESWGVWEYLNPPMMSNTNTEYRTTERYLGKPVYAMAVDLGAAPNATTKDVTIKSSEVKELIFASFKLSSSEMLPYKFNGHEVIFNTAVYSDGELMVFITSNDDQSMKTVTGIVKYTKTTD